MTIVAAAPLDRRRPAPCLTQVIGPTTLVAALVTRHATSSALYSARLGACASEDPTSAAAAAKAGRPTSTPSVTDLGVVILCA